MVRRRSIDLQSGSLKKWRSSVLDERHFLSLPGVRMLIFRRRNA